MFLQTFHFERRRVPFQPFPTHQRILPPLSYTNWHLLLSYDPSRVSPDARRSRKVRILTSEEIVQEGFFRRMGILGTVLSLRVEGRGLGLVCEGRGGRGEVGCRVRAGRGDRSRRSRRLVIDRRGEGGNRFRSIVDGRGG